MKLFSFCIERPVFATVLSLLLVALGLLAYPYLEWRFYPTVFKPVLTIQTSYLGASASEMETEVTNRLEDALSTVPDVEWMWSRSAANTSHIELHFKPLSQGDFVADQSQVLQAISGVKLPDAVQQPLVYMGGEGQNQLFFLGVSDPFMTQTQLLNYAHQILQKQLQEVPGVANIAVWSASSALRIALKPIPLARLGLTPIDVVQRLSDNQLSMPVGSLLTQDEIIPINSNLKLSSITDFQNLVIGDFKGHVVRLGDLATVFMGQQSLSKIYSEVNGKPGIVVVVSSADSANPITVGAALSQRIQEMQATAPMGMHIQTVLDISEILKDSVIEVMWTILEAVVLVTIVTLLFLRNWRAAVIPTVTIPICLIATLAVMFVCKFSVNVMTLLAMVLAVGLVVDDAIVVLENNYRHLEAGTLPRQAAAVGIREISFVVIAMTLCLVAVYLPVGFIEGDWAVYFQQFAFTLSGAVLISGFVALTLSPMLCAYLLRAPKQPKGNSYFERIKQRYLASVRQVLRYRYGVIVVLLGLMLTSFWFLKKLPQELMPPSDAGIIINFVRGPSMANSQTVVEKNQKILAKVQALPEVMATLSFAGGQYGPGNMAFNFIRLQNQRALSTAEVAAKITQFDQEEPGISGGAMSYDINSDSDSFNPGSLSFYVSGLVPYDRLYVEGQKLVDALSQWPGVRNVSLSTSSIQQYDVSINRLHAAQLQVPVANIVSTLSILFGGQQLTESYEVSGALYPIIVQLPKKQLADFSVLQQIEVQNLMGKLFPLSEFVTVVPALGGAYRMHNMLLPSVQVYLTVNTEQGVTNGEVVQKINELARTTLSQGVQVSYGSDILSMLSSNHSMALIVIFGLIFVYLVLAALFESFLDPLIVLFTVPFSMGGALALLYWTGGTLNMLTGIALVTLIGLITKHGVLIVRFANEQRQKGLMLEEAIIEAVGIRLRPILMTTATMVFGAIPFLFSRGVDAAGRFQMGVVMVAGLLVGTLFSLWVVPLVYRIFAPLKRRN